MSVFSYERILKPDGSIDTYQLQQNFKELFEDKQNSPYIYGNGVPYNYGLVSLGSVYVDKISGKVYRKATPSGTNNGWVEI